MGAKCEAYDFVMDMIKELKDTTSKLIDNQQDQREVIARLSENIIELHRFNENVTKMLKELKDYNTEQDKITNENSKFVIKATAIGGFLVFMSPITLWAIEKYV